MEDKNIELEGTRARVRVLEHLQKPTSSPDIIPALDSTPSQPTRTEISTASMKAMSPLPINLQMDHSSSTESAHDQAETNRRDVKRRPSKIPLKSYTAPKPPSLNGGKHSPAPRSRSGDRPQSAQSWRNNQSNSLNNGTSKTNTPLPKSRNSSLVSARDSLSSKLRSSDSLSKLSSASFGGNNINNNHGGNGGNNTIKKQTNGKWGQTNARDNTTTTTEKVRSKTTSAIWNFFKLRDNSQS